MGLNILEDLKKKILVLDGAMGTMIQRLNLSEADYRGQRFANHHMDLKGNNDLLCLTKPDAIRDIHLEYLKAGSDIIETNTFNAQKISQADYDLTDIVYEINYAAAKLAKSATAEFMKNNPHRNCYVAGAIGPTNRTLTLSPDVNNPGFRSVTFDEMKDAYYEQISALADGGADVILVETIFDTLNAKAAIAALYDYFEKTGKQLPVMLSVTIVDQSGRTLSGQTVEAFWISVAHTPNIISVGLNCALGSEQMRPFISELSTVAPVYTSLYPNAGLPNEFGEYDETPEFMANVIKQYAEEGMLNIAGGCCGTTPEHISAFAEALKNISPRIINKE